MANLETLTNRTRAFEEERGWQQYQSPKNLALALCGEAGELAAHFQWLTQAESRALPEDRKQQVAAEMADVLIYLVRMADELGIDLIEAGLRKADSNEQKYPLSQKHPLFRNHPV